MAAEQGLEIERKFLLAGVPEVPAEAERYAIEQGYLPLDPAPGSRAAALGGGRLRSMTDAAGVRVLTHTIKTGQGLVRQERERELSVEEFEAAWPETEGRRLRKTRFRLPGSPRWEIDLFERPAGLVLAEVELSTPDQPAPPPPLAGLADPPRGDRRPAIDERGARVGFILH